MTVYESELNDKNIKYHHIYIGSLIDHLPKDVFGGSSKTKVAPRLVRLEYGRLRIETDVPSDVKGERRNFFRTRSFVREFFEATKAQSGDIVLFEEVDSYHFRLRLRTRASKLITP